jgi:hypothetical protein
MDRVNVQTIKKTVGSGHKELERLMVRLKPQHWSNITHWGYGDSKTFDMNTDDGNYPDEFYNYVSDLQAQLAESRIDGIIIRKVQA